MEETPKFKEETEKKKVNSKNTFEYSIEIYDVWDTTSKRITPFGASRIVEGNSSYLFNEQKGFKEPFPENNLEYKEYELETVLTKIDEIEKKIKESENSKNKNPLNSIKDLKRELRLYRGYKRSIELRGNGSFMILNSDGVPTFQFDRLGNIKFPLYKNVDRSTIYTPSELKTKNISKIIKDNDEKNGQEQIIKWSTYVLLILLVLGVCFMFYMGYKMQKLPIDVANTLNIVAENMQDIGKSLNTLENHIIVNESVEVIPKVNPINR
jgi:hypothetical protein